MQTFFSSLLTGLKNVLFPLFCLACQKEGSLLCNTCKKNLVLNGVFVCPVCHISREKGIPCDHCLSLTPLYSHIALGIYKEDELLGQLIHEWKYNFVREAFDVLVPYVQEFLREQKDVFCGCDFVLPVPLHRRRLAQRGFNQAFFLAQLVSQELALPLEESIQRTRFTAQQATLKKYERQENMKGAFAPKGKVDFTGKNILLIDDVFTTGSTLSECAFVLKEKGASKITAFTLARG